MVKKKTGNKCERTKEQIEVQTRNEEGELRFFQTLKEALDHAIEDKTVWKVSFSLGEERVRLVRGDNGWVLEQLPDIESMVEKFKAKMRR